MRLSEFSVDKSNSFITRIVSNFRLKYDSNRIIFDYYPRLPPYARTNKQPINSQQCTFSNKDVSSVNFSSKQNRMRRMHYVQCLPYTYILIWMEKCTQHNKFTSRFTVYVIALNLVKFEKNKKREEESAGSQNWTREFIF